MPIFFDLDAPQDLIDSLNERSRTLKGAFDIVYSEGYKAAHDAFTQQTPEPVSQWPQSRSFETDPPKFEDADLDGAVSVLVNHTYDWVRREWTEASHTSGRIGWARSPLWVPKAQKIKSEAESAFEAFNHILKNASTNLGETSVRNALEKLRKLEQEGRSEA